MVLYDNSKGLSVQRITKDGNCILCGQPLPESSTAQNPPLPFMDSNYFRLLEGFLGEHLHSSAFNQVYYQRFFWEVKKLGRGYRGSVFLCRHVLDNVVLGDYAVKKIAVGDNKTWLTRMLQEVHTYTYISNI
jgi:hypothetical protein